MNKTLAALAALSIAVGASMTAAWARPNGVFGVLSADGSFRPLAPTAVTATASATKATGTLNLTLTVTIVSTIADATPILCGLNATVTGVNSTTFAVDTIVESDTALATRSGATATCTLKIPYQWTLQGTSDTVMLGYSVTAIDATGAGRNSTASFTTISVPSNGATTRFSVSTHI